MDSLYLFDLLTINNVFLLFIFIVLIGFCAYSFFLALRVRILVETLDTKESAFIGFLSWMHLLVVILGSIMSAILVLS